MKKEQVLDLMNTIGPDLIEEAGREAPARRRFPKAVRAGLIAACLCLALLGTAFAAGPEAVAALIERLAIHITSAEQGAGYTVDGGPMIKYPLSAFSPDLLSASESRESPAAPVSLSFNTWDEVKAFLGKDIPCAWPNDVEDDGYRFQVLLFHTEYAVLWGVDIYCTRTTDVVLSEIDIRIRTEYWQGDDARAGVGGADGAFTQMESYPMPNGATAEIVQYTGPEDFPHANCKGYFMRDGILYEITAFATVPTAEDAITRLHTILDSFP